MNPELAERLAVIARDDAPEWKGLKLAARVRLAKAIQHLRRTGELNRADLCRIGEVSVAQAVVDLRCIRERAPWAMEYDLVARCYRVKGSANV